MEENSKEKSGQKLESRDFTGSMDQRDEKSMTSENVKRNRWDFYHHKLRYLINLDKLDLTMKNNQEKQGKGLMVSSTRKGEDDQHYMRWISSNLSSQNDGFAFDLLPNMGGSHG